LAPYARAQDGRAWFQLLSTTALFALNWYLMLRSLAGPYWVTLLLALPAAGFSIRMFIFQHDCGHGSFFQSMRLNHAVGRVLGVLTLMPYWYWRRTHAIHHATSGDLDHRSFGDVEVWTVDEYLGKSRWGRLGYRLYRNPFILIGLGPAYQFLLKHRFPYDIPRAWKREWLSVMGTNLALAAIVVVAWQTIGLAALLKVQLPITLVSGSLGIWLFYIQHQFEDTYWRENPEWEFHRAGIEGSSYYDLPRVLHWFTGNIGYHHIHHLASRIPNYRLAECFREVPELAHVTRLTILGSLRCARLHLWDEQGRRLVSFRQLRRLAQSSASA
jgi:omega-6 fatty acid desaturase (delta-12 desaturase)